MNPVLNMLIWSLTGQPIYVSDIDEDGARSYHGYVICIHAYGLCGKAFSVTIQVKEANGHYTDHRVYIELDKWIVAGPDRIMR